MAVTEPEVRIIFSKLETGDGREFFDHVADNVDWTVEGTHPLAGHYHSKEEFFTHTFVRLNEVLSGGTQLRVQAVHISGDWAIVELRSMATARNGMRFDNRYCWVVRFENGLIVEVRAYLDSMMVQRLFDENPVPANAG
jgi:ketosteroid isomerase-like protein